MSGVGCFGLIYQLDQHSDIVREFKFLLHALVNLHLIEKCEVTGMLVQHQVVTLRIHFDLHFVLIELAALLSGRVSGDQTYFDHYFEDQRLSRGNFCVSARF